MPGETVTEVDALDKRGEGDLVVFHDGLEVSDRWTKYEDNHYTDQEPTEDYADERGGPRIRRKRPHRSRYAPHKRPTYHKFKRKPSYIYKKPKHGPPKKKHPHRPYQKPGNI